MVDIDRAILRDMPGTMKLPEFLDTKDKTLPSH